MQDAAVQHAADGGWPPERFRTTATGFVVREMSAVHHREAAYGEAMTVTTQVADHRRDVLMRRETRITGVMSATADWVHIGPTGAPLRAGPDLISAFPVDPTAPPAPAIPEPGPPGRPLPDLVFSPWWTEMDPQSHTNHPRYVDWADEALSRAVHALGLDPVGLLPLAERVRFRAGARAVDTVTVSGSWAGRTTVEGRPGICCQFRARRAGPTGPEVVADMFIVRGHIDPAVLDALSAGAG